MTAVWREAHGCDGKLKVARVTGKKLEDTPKIYVFQCSSKRTVLLLVRSPSFCEECFQEAQFADVRGTLGRISQSGAESGSICVA